MSAVPSSERLVFRCWSPDDLPVALSLWGDPSVTRLIGGPFSQHRVIARLRGEIETYAASGLQYWPVYLRSDGAFAGCCGLRPYRPDERIFELGFHLLPHQWGKRLASEAARAVIRYAFDTLRASALFAGHHPDNRVSERLLLRLGFRCIGRDYAPTGLMHPSYLLHADADPRR